MPKQTISTFNGTTQTAGASTNLIITTNALPIIQTISGFANGAAAGTVQYYLQLFNASTVPSNGAVPLYSLQVLSSDGFFFNFGDYGIDTRNLKNIIGNTGLILCLSTTEGTLTIGTGNVTMDCQVDIDSYLIPTPGASTTTGSSVNFKQIWTEANGKSMTYTTLLSVSVTNLLSVQQYVYIFCDDNHNAVPAMNILPYTLPASGTINLDFGSGTYPFGVDTTGIRRYGCNVVILNAAPTFNNNNIPPTITITQTASAANITAYFK